MYRYLVMCFSTILSRVLHKYFVYIPPTPLSNGPSVNKVLSFCVRRNVKKLNRSSLFTVCLSTAYEKYDKTPINLIK